MPDTKYEEAKRCPKCSTPGEVVATNPGPRRDSKVETIECMNDLCLQAHERWIVQVNSDGTIPDRQKGPKEFDFPTRLETMGRHYVEQVEEELKRGETR
jgi:hypothetical protein